MKYVHPSNLPDHLKKEVHQSIPWPDLPWSCPICGLNYGLHKYTIATVPNPETPENVARATFKCVGCDLFTFDQN